MSQSDLTTRTAPPATEPMWSTPPSGALRIYSALVHLVALLVVVQGLLAGVFLESDGKRDSYGGWIDAHARVADAAILLAVVSAVVAFAKLRRHRDLVIGSSLLSVLLVLEGYLGGAIRDDGKDSLTVVHVPLAMALMGLVVWLVTRALRLRRRNA